jgi:hypothetical protein
MPVTCPGIPVYIGKIDFPDGLFQADIELGVSRVKSLTSHLRHPRASRTFIMAAPNTDGRIVV